MGSKALEKRISNRHHMEVELSRHDTGSDRELRKAHDLNRRTASGPGLPSQHNH